MASGIVETSQGSESSSSGPSRSRLVQRLLDSSSSLPNFLNDLLTTQAVVVAGTEAAGFLVEEVEVPALPPEEQEGSREATAAGEPPEGDEDHPEGAEAPALAATEKALALRTVCHIRPDEADQEVRNQALRAFQEIIQPCIVQNKDGAIEVGPPESGEPQFCLVTLMRHENRVVAVSAVITRCRDMERARQRLGSMQLVAGYFDLFMLRRVADQSHVLAQRHQQVLQFASAVATAEGFESAGMNLCNELATRAGATRVALGWVKGRRIKVRALSHTEKFDKKQELVVRLQHAMEECFDQEEPVRFEPGGNSTPNVTRCASELSRTEGGGTVLSLPLRRRDEIVGVLTVQFPANVPLDEATEGSLAVAADLLAPQMYDRHENDRLWIVKTGLSIQKVAKLAIGPKHMLAKLIIVLCIAAIMVLFNLVPGVDLRPTYRVRGSFQMLAVDRRTLSAPYDGYIKNVFFRPGEVVKAGQPIAEFDTTNLRLELAKAQGEVDRARAEMQMYGADPEKQAQRIMAQKAAEQAMAEVALKQYQISLATIKAPFDGVILKGDLWDMKETNKKEGEPLMEVARTTAESNRRIAVEAELAVAERDIQEVQHRLDLNQKDETRAAQPDGKLATSSMPSRDLEFRIKRIVPAGEAKEGENVFKIYADLLNLKPEDALQPGMAGEARIAIEKRTIAWMWTHRLVEWLRLKLWI